MLSNHFYSAFIIISKSSVGCLWLCLFEANSLLPSSNPVAEVFIPQSSCWLALLCLIWVFPSTLRIFLPWNVFMSSSQWLYFHKGALYKCSVMNVTKFVFAFGSRSRVYWVLLFCGVTFWLCNESLPRLLDRVVIWWGRCKTLMLKVHLKVGPMLTDLMT